MKYDVLSLHLRHRDRLGGGNRDPSTPPPDGYTFPIHEITELSALNRSITVHTNYMLGHHLGRTNTYVYIGTLYKRPKSQHAAGCSDVGAGVNASDNAS